MSDPHVPTPREHELPDGDLAVSSHWVWGTRGATTVPADKRPLYRLLMDVLGDVHVPDLMPARLSVECDDLVDARRTVTNIDRGRADFGGVGHGMGFCYTARDAIVEHRDRDPLHLVAVGCSGSKHETDDPLPAADRYRGGYWTNKSEYGETIGDEWCIISAQYGILHPDEEIPYYERTVTDLEGIPVDSDARLPSGDDVETLLDQWALRVYNGLSAWLRDTADGLDPRDVELEVLLGKSYESPLRKRGVFDGLRAKNDLSVSFPFREVEGLTGIGKQRQWMSNAVDADAGLATDGGPDLTGKSDRGKR